MLRPILSLALLIPTALFAETNQPPTRLVTVVKAGHLLDSVNGTMLANQMILIEGEVIKDVSANLTIPDNAKIIDLGSAWVLPGLIDCHTHITSEIENYTEDIFRKSSIDYAVCAHIFAERTLAAGFTACRDVGSAEFIDVALKKAINAGKIPGHGDLSGFSPYLHFDNFNGVVDGIDEIRKKVRWNIKYGADVIKFTATAGVLSEEESVGAPQFSLEEMKAIVEEAAMWGRKVAAHAHGTEGIKRAVQAGVTSIEHGSLLDDEAVALMKQHGTFLVPTVYVGESVVLNGQRWGLPQKLMDKARSINQQKSESMRKAIKAGVKIAYGTDAGVFAHGLNASDFHFLVELGMTPMQAMQSATITAAELLGQTDHLGSIQAGKFADLVAVPTDPLENIAVLEKIPFVMKGGTVHKNTLKIE